MSQVVDKEEAFRQQIRETFEPHTSSLQYRYDHPDGDLPVEDVGPGNPPPEDPHKDGSNIYQQFGLKPFWKFLRKAVRSGDEGHAVANHPQALSHFLTHIEQWEKHEMGRQDPDFSGLPKGRRKVLEWFAGMDDATAEHPEFDPKEAASNRQKMLRRGGTGAILHGEQGTTKTTAMYWLAAHIMEINPDENIIWQSTLDDTEWQIFAPWATVCIPEGIEYEVYANPYSREYRDLGSFTISMEDISRDVITYVDPQDLLRQMAERRPGHVYVVYPDPRFRQCQALTGWSYESIWESDSSEEATSLDHFWFGLMEGLHNSHEYNHWTTLIADEAHKWLQEGASDDEHHWHKKVKDWSTYWGDARKERLSCILAIHGWNEIDYKVRGKVRWGATMSGEEFPKDAPLSGKNEWDQDLGDMCFWNSSKWNHVGYKDIKRNFSVPASIEVVYPGLEAEKRAKS